MKKHTEPLGIWRPGIVLARRTRLPVKTSILALLLLIPLVVVAALLWQRQSSDTAVTRAEIDGLAVILPVEKVVVLVQRHRALTGRVRSGDASSQAALDATRDELGRAGATVLAAVQAPAAFDASAQWRPLADRLARLTADRRGGAIPGSDTEHDELVRELRHFVYTIGEVSSLLYDPEPAAYLLMDMLVSRIIPWSEQVGRLDVPAAAAQSRTRGEPAADSALRLELSRLREMAIDQRFALDILKRNGEPDLGGEPALAATDRLASLAAAAPGAGPTPDATGVASMQAVEAVDALRERVHARLADRLQARADRIAFERDALGVGGLLGFSVMFYLMIAFYRAFSIDLRRLTYAMQQLAQGNLQVAATVRSNDEIGDLAEHLRHTIRNISAMVSAVGSDAALVAHAGHELSAGNRALSDRTEQQAANLEQTSASVQQLASTVEQNAHTASEVNRRAMGVRDIAEQGAHAMMSSIESVAAIQSSTRRMNEIIGVIDDLAFQTNILALNAAVEAARAGDQGVGFAVVATEVRSLAQRSAASAQEIRALIQASTAQVESGVEQIRAAGAAITGIVDGIRGVSDSISHISTASAEQSTGLSEISSAVAQLDEITQRNARMVERAVDQSGTLETQAASLGTAIGNFKLLQGVAPEAVQLVEKAAEYRRQAGSREAFLRGLTDQANGFHDRDMYVFVLDAAGTYLAFGGNAAKVGTRLRDVPGIDGAGLTRAIVDQATQGPGWVEYEITNPVSGQVQTKMSFVRQVDDVFLGCGVYKNLIAA